MQADSLLSEPPGKPKNTRVGSLFFLQGTFPTQELNRALLHCRWILYQLSHQGRVLEGVAYPFSRGTSQPGIETGSPASQADSLPAELPRKPNFSRLCSKNLKVMLTYFKKIPTVQKQKEKCPSSEVAINNSLVYTLVDFFI